MAKFSLSNPPIRVLMIDTSSAGLTKTGIPCALTVAFFRSCGAHVEWLHQYRTGIAESDKVFRDHWDLIVLPVIGSASANEYTQFNTILGYFADTTIPVFIQGCISPAAAAAQAITGITAASGSYGRRYTSTLTNWQSRLAGRVDFYGDAATAAGAAGVTTIATDVSGTGAGSEVMMWSKTVSSHPILMIAGHNSYSNSFWTKPWYGAQWMIDQCPDTDRKQEIKDKIRKRYCLLRWDGLANTDMRTSYTEGTLQSAYSTLQTYGVQEIWLATIWSSVTSADTPLTVASGAGANVANWFLARAETAVGSGTTKFRIMNHETDVVDGTRTYDTSYPEKCTTDKSAFDAYKGADYCYRLHCDQLTAMGFVVGNDGYGSGYPNVQNGNDMNNPSAKFLGDTDKVFDTDGWYGGFGNHLWLAKSETYPSTITGAVNVRSSWNWYGARTLLSFSADGLDSASATEFPTTLNSYFLMSFIYGGGIYVHGGTTNFYLHQWADQYGSLFTTCPDVLASGPWEDMLADLKLGTPWAFNSTAGY